MIRTAVISKALCCAALMCSMPYGGLADEPKVEKQTELLPFSDVLPPLLLEVPQQFMETMVSKFLNPLGFMNPLALFTSVVNPTNVARYDEASVFLDAPEWLMRGLRRRNLEEVEPSEADDIIINFTNSLSSIVGGAVLDADSALKSISQMPQQFTHQLATVLNAYGDAFLEAARRSNSAVSALVQQLVVPSEGEGIPSFIPEGRLNDEIASEETKDDEETAPATKSVEQVTPADSIAARQNIVSLAKRMGNIIGLGRAYGSLAAAFTDEFLIPAGLTQQVSEMMLTKLNHLGSDVTALAALFNPWTATGVASKALVSLMDIGSNIGQVVGSGAYHRNVAHSFATLILGPLEMLDSVTTMVNERSINIMDFFGMKANLLQFAGMTDNSLLSALLIPKGLAAMAVEAGTQVLHAASNPDFLTYPARECDMALKKLLTFCEIKRLGGDCVDIAGDAYRNICLEYGVGALVKAIATGEVLLVTPQVKLDALCEKIYNILFNYGQQTGQGDGYYTRLDNFRNSCENKKTDGLCPVIRDKLLVYCASFNAEIDIVEECTARVEEKFGDCGKLY